MRQLSDNGPGGFKLRSALIGAVVAALLIELAASLGKGGAPVSTGMATAAKQSQLLQHHPIGGRHDR